MFLAGDSTWRPRRRREVQHWGCQADTPKVGKGTGDETQHWGCQGSLAGDTPMLRFVAGAFSNLEGVKMTPWRAR